MNSWIESLNAASADWAIWIWRITWQSAIVIAIAWLLTVLLRRTSPRLRSWIWRLAYLKLLVLMVWTTPVRLAVLPASIEGSVVRVQGSDIRTHEAVSVDRAAPQTEIAAQPFSIDAQRSAELPTIATTDTRTVEIPSSSSSLMWQSYLFLAWLGGMVLVVLQLAWEISRAVKLSRSVQIIDTPELLTTLAEVRTQMRIRSTVRIGESQLAGGPMLVKFWTPRIVFPTGLLLPLLRGEGWGEGRNLMRSLPPTNSAWRWRTN